MMRNLFAVIIITISMMIVPCVYARTYVIPLQTDGAIHHIDKDSIQLAGQNSQSRQIKVTTAVKTTKYSDIAYVTYFFNYNLHTKTIQKKPIILYMGAKQPYQYNSPYIDVKVGSADYIYANYAYYKEFGTYFSEDMIQKYGTTDLSLN